jgi:peptidoglycan/LPS O-acetylase OafA/YrhL
MTPTHPLPALVCLGLALAVAAGLGRRYGAPAAHGRWVALDGLRGLLAVFVFLHHSCVWYFYARTGQWEAPPSPLHAHLGLSSVALFFMITGFLFFSKLLEGRRRPIDWGRLYVSRVLRLVPLYLVVMAALFATVLVLSRGSIQEPVTLLLKHGLKWLGFTIHGTPDLNGITPTYVIVAGVTWSLAYEWLFYLSLPALALLVNAPTPRRYTLLGFAGVLWFASRSPELHHLLSFLGGIAAALLVRSEGFRRWSTGRAATAVPLLCLGLLVAFCPSARGVLPQLLLAGAFAVIAGGNSLGGLLTHASTRLLGEMAYSLYLGHGLLLFLIFHGAIGVTRTREFTPLEHWLVIAGITPVLVLLCFASHRFIERPAMRHTDAVVAWLRTHRTKSPTSSL